MNKKEKYMEVCPKCGSTNVRSGFSTIAAAGVLPDKECMHCGHTDQIFPKIPISEIREPKDSGKIKDRQFINLTYSRGVVGMWKIIGLGAMLSSIFTLLFGPFILGLFMLLFSILITVYSFLRDKYQGKFFMKVIMWIILIYIIVTPGILMFLHTHNLIS